MALLLTVKGLMLIGCVCGAVVTGLTPLGCVIRFPSMEEGGGVGVVTSFSPN